MENNQGTRADDEEGDPADELPKRKAIDGWRRGQRLDERYRAMAQDLAETGDEEWPPLDDNVLRLVFITCRLHRGLRRDIR